MVRWYATGVSGRCVTVRSSLQLLLSHSAEVATSSRGTLPPLDKPVVAALLVVSALDGIFDPRVLRGRWYEVLEELRVMFEENLNMDYMHAGTQGLLE